MKPYTYLLINLICFIIPFLASFYPKHAFYKNWKPFFKANAIVALLFIVWDYFFTKIGVWGFNPEYITGLYIANLPIEEILFFICIPYACVFSYFAFQYLIKKNPLQKIHELITYFIVTTLLVIAFLNFDKLYTSITFFSTSLFLVYLKLKKVNLSFHYLSYLFILPFFFISNGILTGSFFVDSIVWYNDAENLGIRIVNIPIEDIVYGMLLIFLNIELFEYFKTTTKGA
ncbi:MAG TPA: lycopene cyclase domain-containing protein [Flavobacteriaceae bacterium]|nr:lycopene cyclase domain-containing protein [Flavobacteriaceae bacterium]